MADLYLIRASMNDHGTFGTILNAERDPICISLELPWRDNTPFVSCVPGNRVYDMKRAIRHKGEEDECEVWELIDVPGGRYRCQFHIANFIRQLQGCIAPASYWDVKGTKNGRSEIMACASGSAVERMEKSLEGLELATVAITNPITPT